MTFPLQHQNPKNVAINRPQTEQRTWSLPDHDPAKVEDLAKGAAFANILHTEQNRLPKGSAFLQRPTPTDADNDGNRQSAEAIDAEKRQRDKSDGTLTRKDGSHGPDRRQRATDRNAAARSEESKTEGQRERDTKGADQRDLEASKRTFATTKIENQTQQTQSRVDQALNQTFEGMKKGSANTMPQAKSADPGQTVDPKSQVAQIVDYLEQNQNTKSAQDVKKSQVAKQAQPDVAQADPNAETTNTTKKMVEAPNVGDLVPPKANAERQSQTQSVNNQVNAYEAAATQSANQVKLDAQTLTSLSSEAGLSVKKAMGEGFSSFGGDASAFGGDGMNAFANLKGSKTSGRTTRLQTAQAARALLSKAAETLNNMRGTMSQRLSLSLPTQDGSSVRMVLTPQGQEGHKMVFVAASAAGADTLKKLLPEIRQEIVSFPIQVDDIEITTDVIERPQDSDLWASDAATAEHVHQDR